MTISLAAFLFTVVGVAVVALVVGVRLGVRAGGEAPLSEQERVAAALGVLKRHFEKRALEDLRATGAPLRSPDPDRVAELSHGLQQDVAARVGRNTRAD